ncbi:GDSL-type esterase/lipase family protein [Cyclobacterium qasimii]|uniref:Beta-glucosidase n=2 Tax=Cyclobacterium qasimii TaxID=1350429 RepID=S7WSI6_9BACT|nr:GDSL-type esterase/lipase family protein [Cyclobacterium qasimii]EPR67078.1 Beta-glucosidase [Cyclobacterium qasimii M12-11B]GEO19711.1 hypothetical protein CQA01_02450 [Cyclobacterium qasimii]
MNKLLFYLLPVIILFGCGAKEEHRDSEKEQVSEVKENPALLAVKQEGEWWDKRHQTILDQLNTDAELILVGNSIFHTLDNEDRKGVWEKHLDAYNTINMGFSGDRTENVIWRLENGSLENINPKVALVLIGTNNTDGNHYLNVSTAEELSEGINKICSILNEKLPETEILLMGILPYGYKPNHRDNLNKATNNIIAKFPSENPLVHYVDISATYYNDEGKVRKELMPDFLHPNAEGHLLMFEALNDKIGELMTN